MSKIGKQPISIPEGVEVEINGATVKVTGSKGTLARKFSKFVEFKITDGQILVKPKGNSVSTRAKHGTTRSILANMVKGVSEGWTKTLELVGTGYRAEVSDATLILNVGYSHPIKVEAPEGIAFRVEKAEIFIEGIDKEIVGLIAANIRKVREPEPYKGKGIKYKDEVIRRKAGKAAKAQSA
ncbi:MAG: 50S ribosomal protein L6 [Candidatus Woesebacteria bacterium GW2011_GWA1_37_7]|uniref:Large ribosomal subunit protein uL6 n=2 Tax=Candidatus Woeseibacteriota TaxID=1752722 RepID=A0A0G0HFT0_9BACT|nr:MAG: 50S ribosomal protein L6 [Candidatus Woesebacteria bacterium GW2011_GWA1_37_7]OGM18406.1 MAG: 50S ribosomal protein L6 [Candidatus Woesebacteria bacterium RIFCSPHIGHO2_01_FULL_37_10]